MRISKLAFVILLAQLTGCALSFPFMPNDRCDRGARRVVVRNWAQAAPKNVTIFQYEKGSNFSKLEKQYSTSDLSFYTGMHNFDKDILYIRANATGQFFPYKADYIIILDNKLEYRLDAIIPGYPTNACSIEEGHVNGMGDFKKDLDRGDVRHKCSMVGDDNFDFDASCAVPVQDGSQK